MFKTNIKLNLIDFTELFQYGHHQKPCFQQVWGNGSHLVSNMLYGVSSLPKSYFFVIISYFLMSNSNTGNCIEVLSANNSYCYNQYIQEGNNLIREIIRRTPALGRSDIEKERRTNKRTCFINDQLINDLQQIMPLPAVSLSDLPSNYMDS